MIYFVYFPQTVFLSVPPSFFLLSGSVMSTGKAFPSKSWFAPAWLGHHGTRWLLHWELCLLIHRFCQEGKRREKLTIHILWPRQHTEQQTQRWTMKPTRNSVLLFHTCIYYLHCVACNLCSLILNGRQQQCKFRNFCIKFLFIPSLESRSLSHFLRFGMTRFSCLYVYTY